MGPQRALNPAPHISFTPICIPLSPVLAQTSEVEAGQAAFQGFFGNF